VSVNGAVLAEVLAAQRRGESVIATMADKRPLGPWKQWQTERADEGALRAWDADARTAGFAVVTGAVSGLVVLDFDGEAGLWLLATLGLAPHVRTGGGGAHVRLAHPGRPVTTANSRVTKVLAARYPGLDIRGDGGYAIQWGSTRKGAYEQLRDLAVLEPISALPDDLAALLGLLANGAEPQSEPRSRKKIIPEGERHARLHAIGSAMRGRGHERDAIAAELHRVNREQCRPPDDAAVIDSLVDDIVGRYRRGGPAGDREVEDPRPAICEQLTRLLRVDTADLIVVGADLYGVLGPNAGCAIHLCDIHGQVITIEIAKYSALLSAASLTTHVAGFTGVGEHYDRKTCAKVAGLVARLAGLDNAGRESDLAAEIGLHYLATAPTEHFVDDTAGRWEMWRRLSEIDPAALAAVAHEGRAKYGPVPVDESGTRYVRTDWLLNCARADFGYGYEASELLGHMERLGWRRRGAGRRIKATWPTDPNKQPPKPRTLLMSFLLVPAGWEDSQ
jgi:hypothetical protein